MLLYGEYMDALFVDPDVRGQVSVRDGVEIRTILVPG